jgi:multisubunit Na+/H+ antiporter MnhG subunit
MTLLIVSLAIGAVGMALMAVSSLGLHREGSHQRIYQIAGQAAMPVAALGSVLLVLATIMLVWS